jgi:MSHA biogenesis protein MshQ
MPLTLNLSAQHFTDNGYVTNTDDGCTDYLLANLTINNGEVDSLDAAETSASDTDLINNTLVAGVGEDFQLAAPSTGDSGSVGLVYDLGAAGFDWLKPLDSSGVPQNPTGTATFGIFRGDDNLIYMRSIP